MLRCYAGSYRGEQWLQANGGGGRGSGVFAEILRLSRLPGGCAAAAPTVRGAAAELSTKAVGWLKNASSKLLNFGSII
jgi:hypothetical protein